MIQNSVFYKFFCLVVLLAVFSCKHETADVDSFETVCFSTEILPVFQNSCATSGCHGGDKGAAGISLDSYSAILEHVTPFNADKSKAYKVVTGKPILMPPGHALSKDVRSRIWLWIEQGAQETTCDGNGTVVDNGVKSACFARDVLPVLQNSCAVSKCHDAVTAEEGVILTSYTNVMKSGSLVKAGNPAGSKIYQAITANPSSEKFMPPKPYNALGKAAIDSIYSWIANGAKNETCAQACDTLNISYSRQISGIIQTNCLTCHSGTSPNGGVRLTNYAEVSNAAKNGKLIAAIKRSAGVSSMPPSVPLAFCSVRTFEIWKQNNYPQ